MSNYATLRAVSVNEHTEKKGNLTYLSWAWAVDTLLQQDPLATWDYKEPVKFGDTMMVFCTVTAFGKPMTAQLPVMDYKNKAISNPDSMAVNTAMQRCLAKAIALHGLGLYIYAGEDTAFGEEAKVEVLKDQEARNKNMAEGRAKAALKPAMELVMPSFDALPAEEQEFILNVAMEITAAINDEDMTEAHRLASSLDNDEKLALWSRLDSKQRSALKRHAESLKG